MIPGAVTVPIALRDLNNSPVTGKTLTCTLSKDGGAFGASTNSAAEVGSGDYSLALTAGERGTNYTRIKATDGTYTTLVTVTTDAVMRGTDNASTFDPATDEVTPTAASKTGYALHADYDAAKMAAAPGAQMDLVDAPNATALGAVKTAMEAAGSTLATLLTRATEERLAELDAANLPADVAAVKGETATLLTRITTAITPTNIAEAVRDLATSGLSALKALIDGKPTLADLATAHGSGAWGPNEPTEGVTVTQATIGTDGLAIGSVMPYGKITAWLDGSPEWRFDADADGDFSYALPAGSIWTLIAKAPAGDYEDTIATVSTIDIS